MIWGAKNPYFWVFPKWFHPSHRAAGDPKNFQHESHPDVQVEAPEISTEPTLKLGTKWVTTGWQDVCFDHLLKKKDLHVNFGNSSGLFRSISI